MSNDVYQVVGECALVTESTPMGVARVLRYKGALVSPTDPSLKHNLAAGLVAKVGGDETGGVNADGVTVAEADGEVTTTATPSREVTTPDSTKPTPADPHGTPLDGTPAEQVPGDLVLTAASAASTEATVEPSAEEKAATELAGRRTAAREKLAALGGKAPDGRSHPDVLVEYLVAQGGNYADLARAEKSDLLDMVKNRQS